MLSIQDPIDHYLEASKYINWEHPSVMRTAGELMGKDELETVRNCYHFVRDCIKHSWDAQDRRVTVRASDVLREKVGICYAKSNLLAALLRANQIPSGICYQRLTLGDTPETGYCIHALNAVYLNTLHQWIRLDARGNKPGICAEMNLEHEKLAFAVRPEVGEKDYTQVYARPLPITMHVLEQADDALKMYLHALPDKL